ncbi:hypothetical protein ACX27_27330 [Nostoc piscinale CENA21]|uniref:Uncharacterized protein n=1 Tax=Nostoc piscinale CENA21 TaxID=224013 RepID=A0A0M4TP85_9NOSO|nr:hypothetical protein [Nostoc piscinale]ALF55724.1 hypothetical protein ACX27_27330 [Nostoc piscinale CENA21]
MNEIIHPSSEFAQTIGFTSDRFGGWLWRNNGRIVFSFLISKQPNQGNLSELIKAIEIMGLRVAVSTPLERMANYLAKRNFVPHLEQDPQLGSIEVWERSPSYLGIPNQPKEGEFYQHFKGGKYQIMCVSNSVWIPDSGSEFRSDFVKDSETEEIWCIYRHEFGNTLVDSRNAAIAAPHVIYHPPEDVLYSWARELNNFLTPKDDVARFVKIRPSGLAKGEFEVPKDFDGDDV